MAPTNPRWINEGPDSKIWPLDSYSKEGVRTTDWLNHKVTKYHRTVGTTLNTLISTGFILQHIEEWAPTAEQLQNHPDWQQELDRPMFLLISAQS